MTNRPTAELLDALTEKLLTAHRFYLDTQRAYYGRSSEVDETLEQTLLDAGTAFDRAKSLHYQALTLWSPYTDPDSEDVRFATETLQREGLS